MEDPAYQSARAVKDPRRSIAILYGSETGNSEEIAYEIEDMVRRLHFHAVVGEMNEFKLKQLISFSLAIFVTSTTGQGEMPRNAAGFWRNLLRQTLSGTNCLARLDFTVFGLGDSSYPKFCWAARKLRNRLMQLGAFEFFKSAEADERHDDGIDSIYLTWFQELRSNLLQSRPLPTNVAPLPEDVSLPPKFVLRPALNPNKESADVTSSPQSLTRREHSKTISQPTSAPPDDLLPIVPDSCTHRAHLRTNQRLTSAHHWQDVRHLVFAVEQDAQGHLPDLGPGDTCILYPKNSPGDAQKLIDMMGWTHVADKEITWATAHVDDPTQESLSRRTKIHINSDSSTLRRLLTHQIDMTSVPKRRFIRELVPLAGDEREKERLLELVQGGNQQEFYDYASRPRRTILELLMDFPSVKIPWQSCIAVFPLIRGREYSIANAGDSMHIETHVDTGARSIRLELVAALVEYKTIMRKPRQGLCSRYLRHLSVGTCLHIGFKIRNKIGAKNPSSEIAPSPATYSRPLIAVATGTGIAPIRALIQARTSYSSPPQSMGDMLLFFGCRNEKSDYIFREEWARTERLTLYPAFSRNTVTEPTETETQVALTSASHTAAVTAESLEYDRGRNYVQHQIRRHHGQVVDLLRQRAILVVCGNAGRMPKSVREALQDCLVTEGIVKTREKAGEWLGNDKNVTYWQETW